MWLKELTHGDFLVLGGVFSAVCGSLSYLLKVEEGKPFKWTEFVLHLSISAVFGLIAFELFHYEGVPDEVCGALAGSAGWAGSRVARIIEVVICKRLGLKKEDLQ